MGKLFASVGGATYDAFDATRHKQLSEWKTNRREHREKFDICLAINSVKTSKNHAALRVYIKVVFYNTKVQCCQAFSL